jgi:hypothetical protein
VSMILLLMEPEVKMGQVLLRVTKFLILHPDHQGWLDKLSLIVGLASGFAALIAAAIGFYVWLHRRVS